MGGTFTPPQIANLHLWFDAASTYVTKDGSDRVSTWADRSANAWDGTGTGSPLPLWQANQVKGNPAIYYAGAQYFDVEAAAVAALTGADKAFTLLAVVKRTTPVAVNGHVFGLTDTANGIPLVSLTNVATNAPWGVYRRGDDNSLKSAVTQNDQADGEWHLMTINFTGTTVQLRMNGTSVLTTSALDAGDATLSRLLIGGAKAGAGALNSPWIGDMAEIIMYARSLGTTEQAIVEKYLARKYFYAYAQHAATLITPTYDTSGEALHPSVVYRAAGWGTYGHKYWMAMTPYPSMNDEYEDPSILHSNDGETWTVPTGLTNPIDDGGTSPDHNADTELAWNADYTKLYCFWTHWTNASSTYKVYRMESTNGSTWTGKTEVLSDTGYQFVSPGILHDGTNYRMYVVDITGSPNAVKYRTCSTLNGTWSAATTCTINGIPSGRDPWHLSVYKQAANYIMLLDTCTLDASGTEARLGLATSTDGDTWTFRGEFMFKSGAGWDNSHIYRASMIPLGGIQWDLFYSGISSTNHPYIARTSLELYL